jgi:hypothetical protein
MKITPNRAAFHGARSLLRTNAQSIFFEKLDAVVEIFSSRELVSLRMDGVVRLSQRRQESRTGGHSLW